MIDQYREFETDDGDGNDSQTTIEVLMNIQSAAKELEAVTAAICHELILMDESGSLVPEMRLCLEGAKQSHEGVQKMRASITRTLDKLEWLCAMPQAVRDERLAPPQPDPPGWVESVLRRMLAYLRRIEQSRR